MKKTLLFLFSIFSMSIIAQDHFVETNGLTFVPADLTIKIGETVQWTNTGGTHNVNGLLSSYPDNPDEFYSGMPSDDAWVFDQQFSVAGNYDYDCELHVGQGMVGTVTVEYYNAFANDMIITGIIDADLPGGLPKALEFYVVNDIPTLADYGLARGSNGNETDGPTYAFPNMAASAGDYLYLTSNAEAFTEWFGFDADFVDEIINVNGDDAIELYNNAMLIDGFGTVGEDGTGTPWEYKDGWAYRANCTESSGAFDIADWTFSGVGGVDGGTTNDNSPTPMPVGTFDPTACVMMIAANDDNYTIQQNALTTFDVLGNDMTPNGVVSLVILMNPTNGGAIANNTFDITYMPNMDVCDVTDSITYQVCDDNDCATATINITIECPSDFPTYTIGAISSTTNGVPDSLGVTCSITGLVYGIDLQGGTDAIQFFLADDTGSISLYSNDNFGYDVTEGDEVKLTGVVSEFNCLTQFTPESLELLSTGNALNDPAVVTGSITDEIESDLIRINGLSIVDVAQWTNDGPGFNVDVTDGTNTWAMRIDNDVFYYDQPVPTMSFDMIGLVSQFDNDGTCDGGFQVLPRYDGDLMFISNTIDLLPTDAVSVYPNPATERLMIQTDLNVEQITVFNALGQQLIQSNATNELNVNDLAQGLYIITVNTVDGVWTEQFIKE